MNTDKTVCRVIAGVLEGAGVRDVVISPGSRNAPLVTAICACNELKTAVIVDERQAGFIALGKSQISQKPVALICTSGTSMLNYAPAVAEAYYQGLPLIVISADRPTKWIDQDDSQTIRQFRALDNIVKESYDLDDSENADNEWLANRTMNDALIVAQNAKPGPVHINVHLDAPLGNLVEQKVADSSENPNSQRIIEFIPSDGKISAENIERLARIGCRSKILLIAGFMKPDSKLNRAIAQFAKLPNVAVMAETVSNLHLAEDVSSIDVVLTGMDDEDFNRLQPDVVITIGGALISRKIKEYIRRIKPAEHWSLGHNHTTVDCFKSLSKRIDASESYLLKKLAVAMMKKGIGGIDPSRDSRFSEPSGNLSAPASSLSVPASSLSAPASSLSTPASYSAEWANMRRLARRSADEFIDLAPWSDLKALSILFRNLPPSLNLQIGNGTSIRYAQLLTTKPFHSTFCNRGVSGIDGTLTTAIGAASATDRKTLLLIGDTSFCYDLSVLALPIVPRNFKIVLLNNSGGGIFRFVDSTRKLPILDEYLSAPQNLPISDIANTFGFKYFTASDEPMLKQILPRFLTDDTSPSLLEIRTDGPLSASLLLRYMTRPQ